MSAGGIILFVIVVTASGAVLARETARAWDAWRPGTRPTRRQAADWAAARARAARSSARAAAARARPSGFRAISTRGMTLSPPSPAAGGPAAGAKTPRTRLEDSHDPDDLQCGCARCENRRPGGGTARAGSTPAAPSAPGRPAPPASPEPDRILTGTVVTTPATGRTSPVTTPATTGSALAETGGAAALGDDIVSGYARLRADAVSGNINDKIAVYAAIEAACDAAALVLKALGDSMEEDSLYGPEITEPARALAVYQTGCSRSAGEVEEQLRSLAATPVGEMPASRHRAPDRRELSDASGR